MKEKTENNDKKNMIWNMLGALAYGFTSLIYMVIVTRINGIEDAGLFTFSFSMACVFFALGSYSGKTYQITENDKRIKDSDYIYLKFLGLIFMFIIAISFCLIMRYDLSKTSLILLLTLYRGVDVICDTFHAIIQRNGCLYKAGISLFIKTIVLMVAFTIVALLTKNLIYMSLTIIIINVLFCILLDYKNASTFIVFEKFNSMNIKSLICAGFYAFLFAFLTSYVINIPRYILDLFSDNSAQAIFGIIVMPATFMSLVATYITQPYLNKLTNLIDKNKKEDISMLIRKINLIITGLGVIVIIIAAVLGIPVLQILYNVDLSKQKINLLIIIVGSVLYAIVNVYSAVIIALRKSFYQLMILLLTCLVSIIIGIVIIKKYLLFGASGTYLIIMAVQLIQYFVIAKYFLRKDV